MAKRILLVADTGVTRFQLKNVLEKNGYRVFEATEGRQIIKDSFDLEMGLEDMHLVVLDMFLSDYDGKEILKEIKGRFSELPVIVLSTGQTREKTLEILEMGASDFLVKPVAEKEFLHRVTQGLKAPIDRSKAATPPRKKMLGAKDLTNRLHEEIQRSLRSDSPVSLISFRGRDRDLSILHQVAWEILRRIDSAFYLENQIVLLLPATGDKGVEVVQDRIFSEAKDEVNPDDLLIKSIVFPRDAQGELVENYKVGELTNFVLKNLSR